MVSVRNVSKTAFAWVGVAIGGGAPCFFSSYSPLLDPEMHQPVGGRFAWNSRQRHSRSTSRTSVVTSGMADPFPLPPRCSPSKAASAREAAVQRALQALTQELQSAKYQHDEMKARMMSSCSKKRQSELPPPRLSHSKSSLKCTKTRERPKEQKKEIVIAVSESKGRGVGDYGDTLDLAWQKHCALQQVEGAEVAGGGEPPIYGSVEASSCATNTLKHLGRVSRALKALHFSAGPLLPKAEQHQKAIETIQRDIRHFNTTIVHSRQKMNEAKMEAEHPTHTNHLHHLAKTLPTCGSHSDNESVQHSSEASNVPCSDSSLSGI